MALPASWPGYQAWSTAGDLVEPRHLDRPAGLQHHDGARVGRRDRRDQLVLAAGQRDVERGRCPRCPTRRCGRRRPAPPRPRAPPAPPRRSPASPSGRPMPTRKAREAERSRRPGGELDDHLDAAGRPRAPPCRRPRRSPPRRRCGPASSRSRRRRPAGRRRGPARARPRRRRSGAARSPRGTKLPVSRAE